eukprot:scaffold15357_cov112-Isochrysis_galbana.AAC.1
MYSLIGPPVRNRTRLVQWQKATADSSEPRAPVCFQSRPVTASPGKELPGGAMLVRVSVRAVRDGHAGRGEVGGVAQPRGCVLEEETVVVPQGVQLVGHREEG